MPGVLAFIPAWAWRWIAMGLVLVVAAAFGYVKGDEHGTDKLTDYIGKQAKEEVRIQGAREKIVTKTEVKYRDRVRVIYQKGETITKEVYVTQKDDAGCILPVGFVREFNAAWAGEPAGPAAESDRGPSGVPLSEAAAADAHNATSCLLYKAQRDGLIEFYRAQQGVK